MGNLKKGIGYPQLANYFAFRMGEFPGSTAIMHVLFYMKLDTAGKRHVTLIEHESGTRAEHSRYSFFFTAIFDALLAHRNIDLSSDDPRSGGEIDTELH